MSPRQRKVIRWIAIILLPITYMVVSEIYCARSISPRGISTARDFFHRFGEPRRIWMVQRDGQTYYQFSGHLPAGWVLATPSAPPAYIFDTNGQFVAWCADPGDTPGFRSSWQVQSTDEVEVGAVRSRFDSR